MIPFLAILAGAAGDSSAIVPVADAQPGARQVWVRPDRTDDLEVCDLDGLAGVGSVRSVIGPGTVRAGVPLPQVRELAVRRADAETLRNLPNLECLSLPVPVDVDAVPTGLRMLGVRDETFGGLEALVRFEQLEYLSVYGTGPGEPLGRLTGLRWLDAGIDRDAQCLGELTGLEDLRVRLVRIPLPDLRAFTRLTALRRMELAAWELESLDGIGELRALEYVRLCTPLVTDLAPLAELPLLAELRIDRGRRLADVSTLATLPALRRLQVSDAPPTTIRWLRDHLHLEQLELYP